ncbi:hypothetical protein GWK16_02430 [Roseomonas sp. JC162]|uniref:Lipoprotein n=1 Tax=Neoroseomonas marina TaxID=1232220 RepID=A0A848E7E2_9PROT|nr:hypothetical protein [Neoroseomonas marina]NMJ40082.1 hypothetical protein [Neoroseomonas marina]
MSMRAGPILVLTLLTASCAPDTYFPPNDFDRAGTWQAQGINDRNLRAMVADPAHLQQGVGAATDRGLQGAAAVNQLEQGRIPRLPAGLTSSVGGGGGGGGAGGVSSSGGGGGAR